MGGKLPFSSWSIHYRVSSRGLRSAWLAWTRKREGKKRSDKAEYDHPSMDVIYSSLKGNGFSSRNKGTDGRGVTFSWRWWSSSWLLSRGEKICLGTIKIYFRAIDLTEKGAMALIVSCSIGKTR